MTIQPLTGILMAIASLSALGVMIFWHFSGKGQWRRWGAGISLMGLLATLTLITALAAASSFFPGFPGRGYIYLGLYSSLIVSIWLIGIAIIRAQRERP